VGKLRHRHSAEIRQAMNYFTKGPWRVYPPNSKRITSILAEGRNIVVAMAQPAHPETEHNARLIAAAPEMYGVLEMLRKAITADGFWMEPSGQEICRALHTALAKAEGKQP
jgi:hypothetical protein